MQDTIYDIEVFFWHAYPICELSILLIVGQGRNSLAHFLVCSLNLLFFTFSRFALFFLHRGFHPRLFHHQCIHNHLPPLTTHLRIYHHHIHNHQPPLRYPPRHFHLHLPTLTPSTSTVSTTISSSRVTTTSVSTASVSTSITTASLSSSIWTKHEIRTKLIYLTIKFTCHWN